ncbi:MAG TPA: hypothetical protein ENJ46_00910, partial [Hellea balneolensis]|nr:hypothetical protein [Hellea balneolensis]
ADGDNWRRGHWINGRTGLVLLADVVNDLHKNATDTPANVNQLFGVVSGYLIDRPMSARAAISPLMQVYGFDIVERASDIRYITKGIQAPFVLPLTTLQPMQGHMTPLFQRKDPEERLKDVRMNFIDQEHDYQSGAIYARDLLSETVHILDIRAPLVLDQTQAKLMSEAILQRSLTETETATCGAGAFAQNLEVGDVISFENIPSLWQITELDGQAHKTLKLRRTSTDISFTLNGNEPGIETSPVWTSRPDGYVLDIADFTGQGERAGVLVGAVVRPWVNGVVEEPGGVTATLTQPVSVGNLITELHGGPVGRFDQQESVDIYLPGATLSSLNRIDVLGGGNMLAVDNGHEWEIFQCQQAELIATDTYRISGFLRGLYGTDEFVHTDIPVGSRIVSLSSGWQELKLAHGVRGNDMDFSFTVKDRPDSETVSLLYKGQHVRPLSPVHAKAHITGDNLAVTWIRRTRIGGDDWVSLDVPLGEAAEVYEVDFSVEGDVFYTQQVFEPRLDIVLALLEAENGGALNYITLTIYQISQSYGRGVGSLLDIDMGG